MLLTPHSTGTLTYACTHTLRLQLLWFIPLRNRTTEKTPQTHVFTSHIVVIVDGSSVFDFHEVGLEGLYMAVAVAVALALAVAVAVGGMYRGGGM